MRYLLDEHVRLAKEMYRLIDGHHIDPLHRSITGFLFDDVREMPRCERLLVRIVLHGAMQLVLLIERQKKSNQHLAFVRWGSISMDQLIRKKKTMLQEGLLSEQRNDGRE